MLVGAAWAGAAANANTIPLTRPVATPSLAIRLSSIKNSPLCDAVGRTGRCAARHRIDNRQNLLPRNQSSRKLSTIVAKSGELKRE
ncbi:hypothetical protein Afe04nite_19270 [Asanoa ferruginea]|nr:hypothetical protein Afe04nite_19270 [Asanoa ferruginea]